MGVLTSRRLLSNNYEMKKSRKWKILIISIIKKNYTGFILGVLASVTAAFIYGQVVQILYGILTEVKVLNILLVANGTLIITTLMIVIRNFNKRLAIEKFLFEIHGNFWRKTQYFQRQRHYAEEKEELAYQLINNILPRILKDISSKKLKIYKENVEKSEIDIDKIDKINILIDSGTTLTPIFTHLPRLKVPNKFKKKVKFYTNNIVGVQELLKRDQIDHNFKDTDYHLIGGNPLQKYMANTHENMEERVSSLLPDKDSVNISIVTSNWILLGNGLDNLQLCAKGRGHAEFKEVIVNKSNVVIVVAPLGKLIRVGTLSDINYKIDDNESYTPIDINLHKNNIMLLTTFRNKKSISPLSQHSKNLQDMILNEEHKANRNYNFTKEQVFFEPTGDKKEVIKKELPHSYIEDEVFRAAYHYSYENVK